jgi:DNA-binding transcriptional regulator of glucitol operon
MTTEDEIALVALLILLVVVMVARWQVRKYSTVYPPIEYTHFVGDGRSTEAIKIACDMSARRSRQMRGLPLEGRGEAICREEGGGIAEGGSPGGWC